MDVVVVESPAKAKTINRYLGGNYTVLASYGHVRDLPAKDGSVMPDADFAMDWEVDPKARRHLDEITAAVRAARHLYLATDPDREGEAISWHVCQVLAEKKALNGVEVKRVVFNEITRDAILQAFARPRGLDQELVEAYLARRALDYLVGFTLSPVLWRKLPGSRSAGRVQSVALRLICEREAEIESFRAEEYWTVTALLKGAREQTVSAQLTHLDGRKLSKFDLPNREAAAAAVQAVETRRFAVATVERKQVRRQPPPPFITSTLQQEASRKLHFAASRTMKVAQQLYEGVPIDGETIGLITYMRTDGVQMANEAVSACRALIGADYGAAYLPAAPRIYKTKVKNAQEAHEAVRPTDIRRRPADLSRFLNDDQRKLYALIWKRTLASQMEAAVLDQVGADITSSDRLVTLRATGSVVAFDGFYRLYREGRDDPEFESAGLEGEDRLLPDLQVGEAMDQEGVASEQHFTQPPPRFTEASLVKRLEELGIGRPSTYASILAVLQERKYVRLDNRRFVPEDRGRLVTAFLESFFERYVAYTFTADMEEKLDDISGGRVDWKTVLHDFWREFSVAVGNTKELKIKDVLEALDRLLGPHFFPAAADGGDSRRCPGCQEGRLSLKLGKYGAFVGCSAYPTCRYTRPLIPATADDSTQSSALAGNGRLLGKAPDGDLDVWLRNGPYGPYLQLGEAVNGGKRETRPKRVSLPASMDPESVDLEKALALLSLPRQIGIHPETREPIAAGIGRYGPYIAMGDTYLSLKAGDDVLAIGLNRAVDLLAATGTGKSKSRTLGAHPGDGKPVLMKSGRFGPYLQHGTLRARLPKDVAAEAVDLPRALELLAARAASGGNPVKGSRTKPKAQRRLTRKRTTPNRE
jgi:DNA topoisomerase-1